MATISNTDYTDLDYLELPAANVYNECTFTNIKSLNILNGVEINNSPILNCPAIKALSLTIQGSASIVTNSSIVGSYTITIDNAAKFYDSNISNCSNLKILNGSSFYRGSVAPENLEVGSSSYVQGTKIAHSDPDESLYIKTESSTFKEALIGNAYIYNYGLVDSILENCVGIKKLEIVCKDFFVQVQQGSYNHLTIAGGEDLANTKNFGYIKPDSVREMNFTGYFQGGVLIAKPEVTFSEAHFISGSFEIDYPVNLNSQKTEIATGVSLFNKYTMKNCNLNNQEYVYFTFKPSPEKSLIHSTTMTEIKEIRWIPGDDTELKVANTNLSGSMNTSLASSAHVEIGSNVTAIGTSFSEIASIGASNKTIYNLIARDSLWSTGTVFNNILFVNCDLRGAFMQGITFTNCSFRDSDISGADFTGAVTTGTLWDEAADEAYTAYTDTLTNFIPWVPESGAAGRTLADKQACGFSIAKTANFYYYLHLTQNKIWYLSLEAAKTLNIANGVITAVDEEYLDANCIQVLEDQENSVNFNTPLAGRYYVVVQNTTGASAAVSLSWDE